MARRLVGNGGARIVDGSGVSHRAGEEMRATAHPAGDLRRRRILRRFDDLRARHMRRAERAAAGRGIRCRVEIMILWRRASPAGPS